MNLKAASSLLMLTFLLGGCAGNAVVPPCSQSLAVPTLGPQCSHPDEQPSVSPVGSWAGTLSTNGGAGTQPFTAQITAVNQAELLYEGVFTVGDTSYDVFGSYVYGDQAGFYFRFNAPPAELQTATSDPFPYGFNWQGLVTEASYVGNWYVYEYPEGNSSGEGTFTLERLP